MSGANVSAASGYQDSLASSGRREEAVQAAAEKHPSGAGVNALVVIAS